MWNLNSLICFGTLATAAVLNRRQAIFSKGLDGKKQVFGYNFDLDRLGLPVSPVSTVDAKARFRPNSMRKVTRFGPFTLPAMKVSPTQLFSVSKNLAWSDSSLYRKEHRYKPEAMDMEALL
jgi:hypothetical protein